MLKASAPGAGNTFATATLQLFFLQVLMSHLTSAQKTAAAADENHTKKSGDLGCSGSKEIKVEQQLDCCLLHGP